MDCVNILLPPNTKSSKKAKTLPRIFLFQQIFIGRIAVPFFRSRE
jgi:hypothetical protein